MLYCLALVGPWSDCEAVGKVTGSSQQLPTRCSGKCRLRSSAVVASPPMLLHLDLGQVGVLSRTHPGSARSQLNLVRFLSESELGQGKSERQRRKSSGPPTSTFFPPLGSRFSVQRPRQLLWLTFDRQNEIQHCRRRRGPVVKGLYRSHHMPAYRFRCYQPNQ